MFGIRREKSGVTLWKVRNTGGAAVTLASFISRGRKETQRGRETEVG